VTPAAYKGERASIHLEEAEILTHEAFPGAQHIITLRAPETARRARAGQFVHLGCGPGLPMRRPLSLMRAHPATGAIDLLYKVHGEGTALLAGRRPGERLSVLGPIGRPFPQEGHRRLPLLIGGGVGIPPMIFLAEHLRRSIRPGGPRAREEIVASDPSARRPARSTETYQVDRRGASTGQRRDRGAQQIYSPALSPLVLMGSEIPFPFTVRPSARLVAGLPPGVIASMPLLEDWGIASRLASCQGWPGCFEGFVTDLARTWLTALAPASLAEVEIHACGPTPMLRAVKTLAADFDLPAYLCLEEHMACAVGGCAGCTVLVEEDGRRAMRRVCVDGPVFEARAVVFGE
jgi:dihydroorotate dehydrogenase electron transfer subunit